MRPAFLLAALIVTMATIYGGVHGWHESRWDAVAGGVFAMVLFVVGVFLEVPDDE